MPTAPFKQVFDKRHIQMYIKKITNIQKSSKTTEISKAYELVLNWIEKSFWHALICYRSTFLSEDQSFLFFLLSEGINGPRLRAFYENSIRPVDVKPSSLSSTITMKFSMSTQPRDPRISECHPEGEDSGCASLRLSSHHALPRCAEVEGAAVSSWTHDPCRLWRGAISRAIKTTMATEMLSVTHGLWAAWYPWRGFLVTQCAFLLIR